MRRRRLSAPWKIKMVEPVLTLTRGEREAALERAGYNTFLLRSDEVSIDLLTDSGTSAMSDRQWAGMMLGDEAYAGSRNFYRLAETVEKHYGFPELIPTHQGRGAEHIISKLLIEPGDHVPGNMYFTTTRAHQELAGGTFHDVIVDAAHDPTSTLPFKGDIDLAKLDAVVQKVGADKVPYVCVAATVNMAGGQPISMKNLAAVHDYAKRRGILVIFDATRAVENAWFIQQREPGHAHKSVAQILREMCSHADGATMSGKKDSLVNIGGWLAVRDPELAQKARNLAVVYEGLHTYGGLAGRDMEAMAIGIEESVQDAYITHRIRQVIDLGERLHAAGIPVVRPIGGHAVYLDAAALLPHLPRAQLPAQALAAALYVDSGVRAMERGAVSAGRDPATGDNRYPRLELVRLTIPRRVYTQEHMDVVAESVLEVAARAAQVRGLSFVYEPEMLRFFQARFVPVGAATVFPADPRELLDVAPVPVEAGPVLPVPAAAAQAFADAVASVSLSGGLAPLSSRTPSA